MIHRILSVLVLMINFIFIGYSQTVSSDTLSHDQYAISFSFSGLNLGGGIGGKYRLNKNYSVKVEVSVSGSYSKTERNLQNQNDYNVKQQINNINITATFARYYSIRNDIRPYVCGIVGIGFTDNIYDYVYISSTEHNRSITRNVIAGIGIGVEYWLNSSISLSGEQSLRANYSSNSEPQQRINLQNSTSTLILSVYL
jgi:hypothetical protein